jgi:hypothetical protein
MRQRSGETVSRTSTRRQVNVASTSKRPRNEVLTRSQSPGGTGKGIVASWYSSSNARRNFETLCKHACQTRAAVDLMGDEDSPLLQLRHDGRNAKGAKEFELTVAWAVSEWIAVSNAAVLGITFRIRIVNNKFVVLGHHPNNKFAEQQRKQEEASARKRDEAAAAQQDAAIRTLSDLASEFSLLSDKLDSKADLIHRRFQEAWRRANDESATPRAG